MILSIRYPVKITVAAKNEKREEIFSQQITYTSVLYIPGKEVINQHCQL
jgi:hypothetical protein